MRVTPGGSTGVWFVPLASRSTVTRHVGAPAVQLGSLHGPSCDTRTVGSAARALSQFVCMSGSGPCSAPARCASYEAATSWLASRLMRSVGASAQVAACGFAALLTRTLGLESPSTYWPGASLSGLSEGLLPASSLGGGLSQLATDTRTTGGCGAAARRSECWDTRTAGHNWFNILATSTDACRDIRT